MSSIFDDLAKILPDSLKGDALGAVKGIPDSVVSFLVDKANGVKDVVSKVADNPEEALTAMNTVGQNISDFMSTIADLDSLESVTAFMEKLQDVDFTKAQDFAEMLAKGGVDND